jgi:hypothetical protein
MVMTLPRIALEALRRLHGDDRLHVVYPASTWQVHKAACEVEVVMVTMSTKDGFEVTFGFDAWMLRSFSTSIRTAVEMTSQQPNLN